MQSFMKKLIALLLAAAFALGVCACGAETGGDSSVSEAESVESTESAESSEESSEESVADVSSKREPRPKDPIRELGEIKADSVDSFFNNSVFIGYSIMMHFGRYVGEWRESVDESIMGNALFCAGVSMGFTTDRIHTPDTPDNALPLYQGKAYNFADLPAATGCDTLYIGLSGYSDLKRAESAENCVQQAYREAVMGIGRIRDKNPDLKIVILSSTYNTAIYDALPEARCSNEKVYEYNNMVLNYCNGKGIDFVDVSTCLTDHRGRFAEEYANDEEYHIIKEAYYLWLEELRAYARAKTEGAWENPEEMPTLPAA